MLVNSTLLLRHSSSSSCQRVGPFVETFQPQLSNSLVPIHNRFGESLSTFCQCNMTSFCSPKLLSMQIWLTKILVPWFHVYFVVHLIQLSQTIHLALKMSYDLTYELFYTVHKRYQVHYLILKN
jgi:hypothetical protein